MEGNARKALGVVLAAKGMIAGVVLLSALAGGFNIPQFLSVHARWPKSGEPQQVSHLVVRDSAHYLSLSQEGYQAGSPLCAFYPLWPMVLRAGTVVTGGRPVLAGMVLANALSLVGLVLLYRLMERHCGPAVSRDALVLLLACPGALFFSFPYSESLYLFLLMVFFWGLARQRWEWAAVAGFLLPLARPVGIFVLLPLAWFLWERGGPRWPGVRAGWERLGRAVAGLWRWRRRAPATERVATDSSSERLLWPADSFCHAGGKGQDAAPRAPLGGTPWLLLAAPLLGYALYFGLMYAWTGNAFEGFEAQKAYPNSPSIRNMFNLSGFWDALVNVGSLDGMTDGLLDRAFFVLVLVALPAVWRLNRVWFWYVLPAGLVPALTSWFMSYRRYVVVLFPVFVVVAQWLARTKSRWVFWYYVVVLAALQAWAVKQFVNFNWAG